MAKFSKAHFVVIRDAIIRARMHSYEGVIPSSPRVVDQVALEIGTALAKDNRAFNLEQFLSDIRGYRSPKI